jgi:Putative zinc-finger
MIPSCKQTSMLLSQAQDRPLNFADRLRLRAHLAICRRCQRVSRQMEFLRVAVQRYRDGN